MSKKKTNKKNIDLVKNSEKLSVKKVVYVVLTIFLGKLLAFIAFELISINLVRNLESLGLPVEYDQIFGLVYSPLPAYLFWIFILVGVVGGFFLGLTWWRIIYVEHRRWKKRK